jgi:hypothetical protein
VVDLVPLSVSVLLRSTSMYLKKFCCASTLPEENIARRLEWARHAESVGTTSGKRGVVISPDS